MPAEGQDAAARPAPDDRGDHLAVQNGAERRSVPAELGPWWKAAQTFIRWARLGEWERLLEAAQERGVALGMAFLDGTGIRAHQKAAGAARKGVPERHGMCVRRSADLAVGMAPKSA